MSLGQELASERVASPEASMDITGELADLASAGLLDTALDDFPWPPPADDAPVMMSPAASPRGAAATSTTTPQARPYETSLKVFRRHLVTETLPDGTTRVNAEGVIGRACYEDWLSTRSRPTTEPEKTFQRILTCCVSGTDGRQPFSPEEELGVLEQIRRKRVWPAFADTALAIGSKGFRSYGHHEKSRLKMTGELALAPDGSGYRLVKRVKSQTVGDPREAEAIANAAAYAVPAGHHAAPRAVDIDFASCFDMLDTGFFSTTLASSVVHRGRGRAAAEALSTFKARHPGLGEDVSAVAVDLVDASAVQNAASVVLFGNLCTPLALFGVVPEAEQLRVIKHVAFCVRVAPDTEVEFACSLVRRVGGLVGVKLRMRCEGAKGVIVVAALVAAAR